MCDKTNLAIIGYGYIGNIYKNACDELCRQKKYETYYKYDLPTLLENFKLKAIVDPKLKTEKRNGIYYFNSIDNLLERKDLKINAAVIATPIKTHFNIAGKLIKNNISLLIEKPVCENGAEVRKLINLSKKHKVRIMPGHVERYNPVTYDVKEAVKYRIYGKVRDYRFIRTGSKPARVTDNLLIDKLVHDLDLVQCIFGNFKISNVKIRKVDNEIMECNLCTTHNRGYKGEIFSSWITDEKQRKITINFERARLNGDLIEKRLVINRFMEFSKEITGYKNNQIKDQLVDFIAYKHHQIRTLVNMQDALKSALAIDEITGIVKHEF